MVASRFRQCRAREGKPSYVPVTVNSGPDVTYVIGPWGSNPRTITFTRPGFANGVLEWQYQTSNCAHSEGCVSVDIDPEGNSFTGFADLGAAWAQCMTNLDYPVLTIFETA